MGHVSKGPCQPWLLGAVVALALAGAAVADTTPPQLINLSVFPQSVDTSAGPAVLAISITAQDAGNGFNSNAAGNGSIALALAGGTTVFSRQGLPITGGTSVNPIFQFTLTLPQYSRAGAYAIGLTLVDNASNTAVFSSASLVALGFPSVITVTEGAFGSLTLSASTANAAASGASGSVVVTASNGGFAWTAVSNVSWLTVVSGASGAGSGIVGYSAAPNSSPTPRSGIITVAGQTLTVMQAGAGSVLNTTQTSLQFAYQMGGAAPPPQTITAYSSGVALNFTATASSAGNWLFVSPASGQTSSVLSVFVNPTGLSPGAYMGEVVVSASGSSNGSQTATVTLTVSGSPLVTINPGSLSFSFQQGGSIPASQTLSVSAAAVTSIGVSASSAGNWLAVSPPVAATPFTISVTVSPTGLAAGTYFGSIALATPGGVQNAPVTLVVSSPSSIAINPASLAFSYSLNGAVPASQTLTLSGGAAGLSFSATASSSGNWLALGASTGTIPGAIAVSIKASGLGAGTYSGAITLTGTGQPPQIVPVTLIVGAGFSVTPSSLTFNVQAGAVAVASQTLTIGSSQLNAAFLATTSDSTQTWLIPGTTTPFQAGVLSVSVNPSLLALGSHTGAIVITGAGGSQSVPVTAIVNAAPVLTIAPSSLAFSFGLGGANPASQTANVTFNGTALSFGATASSSGWLSVSASSTLTPSVLTISVNPSGLGPGTYNGYIGLAVSASTTQQQNLPVTLLVTGTSSFTASPTSFEVNYQLGDPNPAGKVFTLSGTASTYTTTVSSTGNWLTVSPASGSIPATLSAGLSPAGLSAGSYTGTIQIAAPGAAVQAVTISLNVISPQSLTLTPSSLAFSAAAGGSAPATQNITVACPQSALSFRPVAASPGNWLSVTVPSVIGNNQIVVAVNPAGLGPNTYQGAVTIFGTGACNTTQTLPVTLTVSAGAGALGASTSTLTFAAGSLAFATYTGGAAPAPWTVGVSCGGVAAAFTVSVTSTGGWLSVSALSGIAPGTVTVTANPSGLMAGTYSGSITANSATCGASSPLPVTFTVTSLAISSPVVNPVASPVESVTVTPSSLAFAFQTGGSVPASQPLSVSGPGTAFSVFAPGAGWLSVTPSNGLAPANLAVSVNPAGLAAGYYSAVLVIVTNTGTSGTAQSVTVMLTVSPAPVPVAPINPLSFTYQLGDPSPALQQILVASGPAGLALGPVAFSAAGWLSISPANATIPATLTVMVNPIGLTVGSYSGAITVGAQTVPVTLLVTAPPAPLAPSAPSAPIPFISVLVNGASLLGGPIAPGEIISIFGRGLGPAAGATMQMAPSGQVANSLAGTQVTIGGVPAPILYAQDGLIGVVVPYSVAGQSAVPILIQYQGVTSALSTFAVTSLSPAIFTDDNSGHGQGAILNEDASINGAGNPASRGSIGVIFAEGAGLMSPAGADGAISGLSPAQPLAPVSVLVDGQQADISYAGDAPEEVSGMLQVNFRIPQQVSTGPAISIVLVVGPRSSQPGVTMAIQ